MPELVAVRVDTLLSVAQKFFVCLFVFVFLIDLYLYFSLLYCIVFLLIEKRKANALSIYPCVVT